MSHHNLYQSEESYSSETTLSLPFHLSHSHTSSETLAHTSSETLAHTSSETIRSSQTSDSDVAAAAAYLGGIVLVPRRNDANNNNNNNNRFSNRRLHERRLRDPQDQVLFSLTGSDGDDEGSSSSPQQHQTDEDDDIISEAKEDVDNDYVIIDGVESSATQQHGQQLSSFKDRQQRQSPVKQPLEAQEVNLETAQTIKSTRQRVWHRPASPPSRFEEEMVVKPPSPARSQQQRLYTENLLAEDVLNPFSACHITSPSPTQHSEPIHLPQSNMSPRSRVSPRTFTRVALTPPLPSLSTSLTNLRQSPPHRQTESATATSKARAMAPVSLGSSRLHQPHAPRSCPSPPQPSPDFAALTSAASQIVTPSASPIDTAPAEAATTLFQAPSSTFPSSSNDSLTRETLTREKDKVEEELESTAVARRPAEPSSLYEELLRYHQEHDEDDSERQVSNRNKRNWKRSPSSSSIQSHEDSKLPASAMNLPPAAAAMNLPTHGGAQNLLGKTSSDNSHSQDYLSSPCYQELQGARHFSPSSPPSSSLSLLLQIQEAEEAAAAAAAAAAGDPCPVRAQSSLEQDEAIARILQEELNAEQRKREEQSNIEEESILAALRLQQAEEEEAERRQRLDDSLPLVLNNDTSLEEQYRILQQIQLQQEETQLRQALTLSTNGGPTGPSEDQECTNYSLPRDFPSLARTNGSAGNAGVMGNLATISEYDHRRPEYSQHNSPGFHEHRRVGGFDSSPERFGNVDRRYSGNNVQARSPGYNGGVSGSVSDAFQRQFRPRDDPSLQQQRPVHRVTLMQPQSSVVRRPPQQPTSPGGRGRADVVNCHPSDWEHAQHQAFMEYQRQPSPPPPLSLVVRQSAQQSENSLIRRGAQETERAVQGGRAHIVQCQGCRCRLQAPVEYALVYCPSCGVVSPGRSYTPDANAPMVTASAVIPPPAAATTTAAAAAIRTTTTVPVVRSPGNPFSSSRRSSSGASHPQRNGNRDDEDEHPIC